MVDASIVGIVITVVIVAIVLFIATTILGNLDAVDCTKLAGYVPVDLGSDGRVGMTPGSSTSGDTPAQFNGWSGTCKATKDQQMAAFSILTIVVFVVAAAAVLVAIRRMS